MDKRKKAALVKRQRRIFEGHKKHFWCADGTMLERLIVGGIKAMGAQHEPFIDFVINNRHTWQIIAAVFCDDGSERYYKTVHFELTGKIKELQPEVNQHTDKLIASQNANHFVSWGWWASPAGNIGLEQAEESVINRFDQMGAWNKDFCAVQLATRMNKTEE